MSTPGKTESCKLNPRRPSKGLLEYDSAQRKSLRLSFSGEKSGKFRKSIPFAVAMHSPFLHTMSTTKLGRKKGDENNTELTIERKIERKDINVLINFMELKAKEAESIFPCHVSADTLKAQITSNRTAQEYPILVNHARFFGLLCLLPIIQQAKTEAGFYTKAITPELHHDSRRPSQVSKRACSILSKARKSPAKFLIRPCSECKSSCNKKTCTFNSTSTLRLNRGLQQKEMEMNLMRSTIRQLAAPDPRSAVTRALQRSSRVTRVLRSSSKTARAQISSGVIHAPRGSGATRALPRSSGVTRACSEGDLNSVRSAVTTWSIVTTKTDFREYKGRALRTRNGGGLPVTPGFLKGRNPKRRKRLHGSRRRAMAKDRAAIKRIRKSYEIDGFQQQVSFWNDIDSRSMDSFFEFTPAHN
ncbi:hypothetical protein AAMO2058_001244200 [Amorphochlora amoebiformis]